MKNGLCWWCLKCTRSLHANDKAADTVTAPRNAPSKRIHDQCGGAVAWSKREALK